MGQQRRRRARRKLMQCKVAELIPPQDRCYMLSDLGGNYRCSRHGTAEANGLLVFTDAESATRFCEQVAWPAYDKIGSIRPVVAQVSKAEMWEEALEVGAVCRAEGTTVRVGLLE